VVAKKPKVTVTERDERILAHVLRFRVTTYEALKRLFFPENGLDAVKSWVRRMQTGGYLRSAHLLAPRRYYYLTPKAARLFGASDKVARDLEGGGLLRVYGILAYCCMEGRVRRKLSRQEFEGTLPELVQPSLVASSTSYYLDDDEVLGRPSKRRLGFVLVDSGRASRRIHSQVRHVIAERFKFPEWRQLFADDRFILAIVTVSPQRKEAIEKTLRASSHTVPWRVAVVSDLKALTDVADRRAVA
jgi:hypothetical protein